MSDTTTTTCPKCHGDGVWPMLPVEYCSCPVGRERQDEAQRRDRMERRLHAWEASGVPARFAERSLDGHPDTAAVNAARTWADGPRTGNLLIGGAVGKGKTGLAVGLVRHLVMADVTGIRFVSVPAMLDQLRPGPDEDRGVLGDLIACHLLVLDDLGAEKASVWVHERLYVLLNGRYEAMRSTVVTTNLDLPALEAAIGERTVSRLTEDLTEIVVTGGRR